MRAARLVLLLVAVAACFSTSSARMFGFVRQGHQEAQPQQQARPWLAEEQQTDGPDAAPRTSRGLLGSPTSIEALLSLLTQDITSGSSGSGPGYYYPPPPPAALPLLEEAEDVTGSSDGKALLRRLLEQNTDGSGELDKILQDLLASGVAPRTESSGGYYYPPPPPQALAQQVAATAALGSDARTLRRLLEADGLMDDILQDLLASAADTGSHGMGTSGHYYYPPPPAFSFVR